MQDNYNIYQTILSITINWEPCEKNPARLVSQVFKQLSLQDLYQFGRPREHDLRGYLN